MLTLSSELAGNATWNKPVNRFILDCYIFRLNDPCFFLSRWVFILAVLFFRLIFYHLLIEVSKTKITSSNLACCLTIQGYESEYVPTPLASGGVRMFIYETLNELQSYRKTL